MDTAKNVFLTIVCVVFALLVAFCVGMCFPGFRNSMYRMLNVSPTQEKTDLVDAKTELYIETINYKARLESMTAEKNRIQAQLEALQEDYDEGVALLNGYQSRIDTLNSQLASSQSDNTNLQNEVNALISDVQILNGQITGYTNEITRLNNDLGVLNDNAINLTNQIAILEAAKNALQIDYDLLNNEVGSLRMSNNRLNNEISNLQATNEAQENQIYSLNMTITELNNQIMYLQDQLYSYQNVSLTVTDLGWRKQVFYAHEFPEFWTMLSIYETYSDDYFVRNGSQVKEEVSAWSTNLLVDVPASFDGDDAHRPYIQYDRTYKASAGNSSELIQYVERITYITEDCELQFHVFYNDSEISVDQIDDDVVYIMRIVVDENYNLAEDCIDRIYYNFYLEARD